MRKNIRKILESQVISATESGDANMRRRIRNGKIEAVKIGNTWIIDKADIPIDKSAL